MNKPRILIWFVSNDGRFINGAMNILERQHNGVEVVGVTAAQKITVGNLPFIPLNELVRGGGGQAYDVLLVAGARLFGMSEVVKFAKSINLDTEKLLGDWIVCIPGFTLQKYRQLQRSRLTIFSKDCFGGFISNTLGLPFRSPFVNLFLSYDDFIRFLKNPRVYIDSEPIFEKLTGTSNEAPDGYPVLSLGNIYLNMMHYSKIDDSIDSWNERKKRINWYNIIAITSAGNEEDLEKFDRLPYGKKICFVPFKSDVESAFYIDRKIAENISAEELKTFCPAHIFARGNIFYYDMFDMLLYGKKTPLIEM